MSETPKAVIAREVPGLLLEGWKSRSRVELADGSRRIYLHHIRKTGGTSITASLLSSSTRSPKDINQRLASRRPRVARAGDMVFSAHDRIALQAGWYTYGWSHIPAWRLRLRPQTYTVTVLRDPVARVLSLYRYLDDPDSDDGQFFGASREERALAVNGFDNFLDVLPASDLLNQLHMFSERLDPAEAANRIGRCSLAFLVDDMAHGVARLAEVVGRGLPERTERRSTPGFEPTEAQRDRLREAVSAEYALLDRLRPKLDAVRGT